MSIPNLDVLRKHCGFHKKQIILCILLPLSIIIQPSVRIIKNAVKITSYIIA